MFIIIISKEYGKFVRLGLPRSEGSSCFEEEQSQSSRGGGRSNHVKVHLAVSNLRYTKITLATAFQDAEEELNYLANIDPDQMLHFQIDITNLRFINHIVVNPSTLMMMVIER